MKAASARRPGSLTRFALLFAVLAACGGGGAAPATPVGSAPAPAPANPPPATGIPAEVTQLLARWETCWHFAGEEPYDAERAKQIADGIAKSCPGNDEERARLATKYAQRADVMRELAKLDAMQ